MDKMRMNHLPARIGVYCLGLMLPALGVTVSAGSILGVSPVNLLQIACSTLLGCFADFAKALHERLSCACAPHDLSA